MNIIVERTTEPIEQPVLVLDLFNCSSYTTLDRVDRPTFKATVDGVPWTIAQTEQALHDSYICRCDSCVCCRIRQETNKLIHK